MARSSYYLLALMLLFLASLLWLSPSLKPSAPILTLAYGDATRSLSASTLYLPKAITPDSPGSALSSSSPFLPVESYKELIRSPFPSKIWQKAGPNGIDDARQNNIKSWQQQNPNLRHEVLTDGSAEQYVRDQYANFPDILDIFFDLEVPILKADFLRQLILYADGGIWSDLDVTCHKPIESWIPAQYRNRTNIMVGLEFDGLQFATWTVMAKPKTSHIAAAIKYIIEALEDEAYRSNTTIPGLTMNTISDVVDVTGPRAMTGAILKNLSTEMGVPVGLQNISNLYEPVLFHDVLVLPNAAFAAGVAGWPKDRGPYLVEHHYAGSWKNDEGGEHVQEDLKKSILQSSRGD